MEKHIEELMGVVVDHPVEVACGVVGIAAGGFAVKKIAHKCRKRFGHDRKDHPRLEEHQDVIYCESHVIE